MDFGTTGMNPTVTFNAWPAMFGQQQTGQPPMGMSNGMAPNASVQQLPTNGYPGFMPTGFGQQQQVSDGMPTQLSPLMGSRSPPGQFLQQPPAQQPTGMPGFPQQYPQMPNGYGAGNFGGTPGAGGAGGQTPGFGMAGGAPNGGGMPGMPGGYPQGMDPSQMMQMWMWQMQMQAAAMQQQQASQAPFPLPSGDDDKEFAKALAGIQEHGRTPRQVIEDFANLRKQSVAGWKDHYLTHKPRLDKMAARISGRDQPVKRDLAVPTPAVSAPSTISPSVSISSASAPTRPITAKKPILDSLSGVGKHRAPDGKHTSSRPSQPLKTERADPHAASAKRAPGRPSKPKEPEEEPETRAEPAPAPRTSLPSFKKHKGGDTDVEPPPKRARVASPDDTDEESADDSKPEMISTRATRSTSAAKHYGRKVVGTTSSSRAVPLARPSWSMPDAQWGVEIPPLPDRTPSPPPLPPNKHFTEQEKTFFLRFIRYHLDRDPELTKGALAAMMAQQAPHRAFASWQYHWQRNSAADIIYNMAEEKRVPPPSVQRPRVVSVSTPRPPESASPSTTRDASESDGEPEPPTKKKIYFDESPSEDGSGEEGSDDEDLSDYDHEMGQPSSKLTEGDLHALGKYVASKPAKKWKYTLAKYRWEPMAERHPQRNAGAWGSHYKRNKGDVLDLARRYRRRTAGDRTPLTQSHVSSRIRRAPLSKDAPSSDLPMDTSSDFDDDGTTKITALTTLSTLDAACPLPAVAPTAKAAPPAITPPIIDIARTPPTPAGNARPSASPAGDAGAVKQGAKASLKERARNWTALGGEDSGDGSFSPLSPVPPASPPPPIQVLQVDGARAPSAPRQAETRPPPPPPPYGQPPAPGQHVRQMHRYAELVQPTRDYQEIPGPLDPLLVMARGALGQNGVRPPNGTYRPPTAGAQNGLKAHTPNGEGEKDMSVSPIERPSSEMDRLRQMLKK